VLNHVCDPGSRFQLLLDNANASIVAHCRKKLVEDKVGPPPHTTDDGEYGDVAVIQYGKKNGATCFYQALTGMNGRNRLDAKFPAPSTGQTPWITPAQTAHINCGECHDNGPFIRSPYIAQLVDIPGNKNVLPGSHDWTFNASEPYAFVGDDFATWRLWKVEIKDNTCNGCHRMGVSNLRNKYDPVARANTGAGTSRALGIYATGETQEHKNEHSTESPIWMKPDQITFDKGNRKAALAIRACAVQFVANKFNSSKPLPAGCTVTWLAGAYRP
jgi:hypothetical protein